MHRDRPQMVALRAAQHHEVGGEQAPSSGHQRVEHGLGIGWRGGDDAEDLGRRGLLLQRLVALGVAVAQCSRVPRSRPSVRPLAGVRLPKLGPELLDRRGIIAHHDPPNAPRPTFDRQSASERVDGRRHHRAPDPHLSRRARQAPRRAYDGAGAGRCDGGHRLTGSQRGLAIATVRVCSWGIKGCGADWSARR